jgi:hypothetical protein
MVRRRHKACRFQASNINHELCRYTDDVKKHAGFKPATSAMNSVATLMTSKSMPASSQQHQP